MPHFYCICTGGTLIIFSLITQVFSKHIFVNSLLTPFSAKFKSKIYSIKKHVSDKKLNITLEQHDVYVHYHLIVTVCMEEKESTDLSLPLEDLHPWESPPRAESPDAPILPPIMAELLPKLPLLSLTPPPVLQESPPLLPRPLPLYLQRHHHLHQQAHYMLGSHYNNNYQHLMVNMRMKDLMAMSCKCVFPTMCLKGHIREIIISDQTFFIVH